jgi:hypothetical protein
MSTNSNGQSPAPKPNVAREIVERYHSAIRPGECLAHTYAAMTNVKKALETHTRVSLVKAMMAYSSKVRKRPEKSRKVATTFFDKDYKYYLPDEARDEGVKTYQVKVVSTPDDLKIIWNEPGAIFDNPEQEVQILRALGKKANELADQLAVQPPAEKPAN